MKLFKLRELKQAFTALFNKPYTNNFPAQPHIPFPRFRGRPVPSDDACIACGACAEVCPSRAIEVINTVEGNIPSRAVIWHYDLCIFCGQCERLCTTIDGVKLSNEYDLATDDRSTLFARIDKELILCESCRAIIAPRAQLLWLIKRMGALASGNFNLVFEMQKELGLVSRAQPPTPGFASRQDLYRVLCPHCRHQALIFNQTGKQPPALDNSL
ncbi:MAG: 4Fe-4S binding protein [Elusimicrobia bacterium]|nr:4Fe-4S binding protein [Elusimicrobiota bacterium]